MEEAPADSTHVQPTMSKGGWYCSNWVITSLEDAIPRVEILEAIQSQLAISRTNYGCCYVFGTSRHKRKHGYYAVVHWCSRAPTNFDGLHCWVRGKPLMLRRCFCRSFNDLFEGLLVLSKDQEDGRLPDHKGIKRLRRVPWKRYDWNNCRRPSSRYSARADGGLTLHNRQATSGVQPGCVYSHVGSVVPIAAASASPVGYVQQGYSHQPIIPNNPACYGNVHPHLSAPYYCNFGSYAYSTNCQPGQLGVGIPSSPGNHGNILPGYAAHGLAPLQTGYYNTYTPTVYPQQSHCNVQATYSQPYTASLPPVYAQGGSIPYGGYSSQKNTVGIPHHASVQPNQTGMIISQLSIDVDDWIEADEKQTVQCTQAKDDAPVGNSHKSGIERKDSKHEIMDEGWYDQGADNDFVELSLPDLDFI